MAEMNNSKFIKEHKCPNCNAPLIFNPANGKLSCEYCGGEYDIPEEPAETAEGAAGAGAEAGADGADDGVHGFDFREFEKKAAQQNVDNIPIYLCKSCGAEVLAPPENVSLTCPYCSNNIVLTDKISGNMRPDGIVPFRFTAKELPEKMNAFYKNKKLLPRDFFSRSQLSKVTGIYVPFWLFSGRVEGNLRFRGDIVTRRREGQYEVTRVDHYRLIRHADVEFANIPIDASERIRDELMDSVEPFDMADIKKFDASYLAGYTADRFDVAGENLQKRATSRMMSTAHSVVRGHVGGEYSAIESDGGRLEAKNIDAKYVLLPVYLFNRTYNGKEYEFAVNGQTGKCVGEVPTGKSVSRLYFLKRFGIVAGIVMILSIISYLTGGAL